MESCIKHFVHAMNDISTSYEVLECHEMIGLQNVTVYKLYSQRDPRDLNFV